MTSEEILIKIIKKAELNNYKTPEFIEEFLIGDWRTIIYIIFDHDFAKAFWGEARTYISSVSVIVNDVWDEKEKMKVINKKEFIKYFGKETLQNYLDNRRFSMPLNVNIKDIQKCFKQELHYQEERVPESGWQYHLQQMALEPEPLKYLEKFL